MGRVDLTDLKPAYEYSIKDHLGNTAVLFEDKNADGLILTELGTTNPATLEVLKRDFYYPFGMSMEGDWQAPTPTPAMNYLYNGKEYNEEIGWYDYGARYYDPTIGRWNAIDPLAESYYQYSPYNYVMGNPISFIDPNGMNVESTIVNDEGEIIDYQDDGDNNIYLNERSSENIIGTEQAEKEYVEGNYLDREDLNSDANLPTSFLINTDPVDIEPKQGLGILAWVSGGGTFKGVSRLWKLWRTSKSLKALPKLDATGKVHGTLPKVKDLANYSKEELKILLKELKQSVKKRIEVTSKLGRDRAHGQRQGAEQDLIKSLEKYLGNK